MAACVAPPLTVSARSPWSQSPVGVGRIEVTQPTPGNLRGMSSLKRTLIRELLATVSVPAGSLTESLEQNLHEFDS